MDREREYGPIHHPQARGLIEMASGDIESLVSEAKGLLRNSSSNETRATLRQHFVGAVFQSIAFQHLRTLFSSKRLLDSDQTLEFYRLLYPKSEVAIHPFSLDTLHQKSVPDALVLKPQRNGFKVSYICESSATKKRIENKAKALRSVRKRHINIFGGVKLLLTTTWDVPPPEGEDSFIIRHEVLPFTNVELGIYCGSLLS